MKELLDEVRINYDYIIINSASIIPVSDTRVLANNVDAAILVVRSNKSTNKNVIDGYNKLKDTGINILGIILNDINSKSLKKLYISSYLSSFTDTPYIKLEFLYGML